VPDAADVQLRERLRREQVRVRELRGVVESQAQQLEAQAQVIRVQGLRIEALERQLGSGSDDSGTPTSKESIAAKARRRAERAQREADDGESDQAQEAGGQDRAGDGRQRVRGGSSRERSKDRTRGGQPGHPGHGLSRDPDPQERRLLAPPAVCGGCGGDLADAQDAGTAWSQVWDVRVIRHRVEYLLPRRECGCCGKNTTACPPPGAIVNGISYGPVLNTAAVALTAFGNVPTERAAHLVGMLYGQEVSAGFVDRANTRLAAQLTDAGFEQAMMTALLAEPVLAADESPVEVVTPATDPETGEPVEGAPHVMVIRTPDERLTWLTGLDSRRHDTVIAALRTFVGHLIVDGYPAYQKLLQAVGGLLAGLQQCCQHVFRRARGVAKLGPGSLQASWTREITKTLTEAHDAVQAAKTQGRTALDPDLLAELRARFDHAVETGIIHNRHRDWDGGGNHPGYTLATWLKKHAEHVWHFTRHFQVEWTSNAAERGIKPAKRHQAVSGYWQTHQTLDRWCLIQSYLTSARNHGLTILDAITRAQHGHPWLPQPAAA